MKDNWFTNWQQRDLLDSPIHYEYTWELYTKWLYKMTEDERQKYSFRNQWEYDNNRITLQINYNPLESPEKVYLIAIRVGWDQDKWYEGYEKVLYDYYFYRKYHMEFTVLPENKCLYMSNAWKQNYGKDEENKTCEEEYIEGRYIVEKFLEYEDNSNMIQKLKKYLALPEDWELCIYKDDKL